MRANQPIPFICSNNTANVIENSFLLARRIYYHIAADQENYDKYVKMDISIHTCEIYNYILL